MCSAFESNETSCPQSVTRLKELVDNGRAEGFHLSHFPQGHGPTQFEKFWDKSLQFTNDGILDEYCWQESYKIQHEKLFEPYIIMASADVPLYDERFHGYGLNKVSHLAAVSAQKGGEFFVLPGVFLVAPAHERSKSWAKRYGKTQSDENMFNQLVLKGLYYNFTKNLENGKEPVVSKYTRSKQQLLLKQEKESKQKEDESSNKSNRTYSITYPTKYLICH